MYYPIEKTRQVALIVCDAERRLCHRFRAARLYGGVATADCIGCNLGCMFCWSWNQVHHPKRYGSFYTTRKVADKLVSIARKKDFQKVRISAHYPAC